MLRLGLSERRACKTIGCGRMRAAFSSASAAPDVAALLDHIEDDHGASAADHVLAVVRGIANWFAARHNNYSPPIVRGMRRRRGPLRSRMAGTRFSITEPLTFILPTLRQSAAGSAIITAGFSQSSTLASCSSIRRPSPRCRISGRGQLSGLFPGNSSFWQDSHATWIAIAIATYRSRRGAGRARPQIAERDRLLELARG